MNSMTGFGHGTSSRLPHTIDVQISSYNRKQLDIRVKSSRGLESVEKEIRDLVAAAVSRGSVFVNINRTAEGEGAAEVHVDAELARQVQVAAAGIAAALEIDGTITIRDLLAIPDLVTVRSSELPEADTLALVREATQTALAGFTAMRAVEGEAMLTDLSGRRETLRDMLQKIREIGPKIVDRYREKLFERVAELVEGIEHDDERLHREVVVFADRCDITEELIRQDSHLQQMQTLFDDSEPVGRKLDFLIQEMVREINTIGSKSQDAETARIVVDFKTELDRIREQVQNVE